ncbi:MAG: GFA family protein [Verrucomicrobiota bacterium]
MTAFARLASMKSNVISGGCLCGSVRYEATGAPDNITHCHCSDCRRSSGAPFVTWASFRRGSFRFITRQPREMRWGERLRSFCPDCGTPLTFMTEPRADEVDVTVCSFDNPASVKPADHTWTEDRLPWIRLADDLPTYEQKRQSHVA